MTIRRPRLIFPLKRTVMRKTFVITFLAACLIAAYTLSASAQTVNACYQKNDGQLRRVNAPADCRPSEIPVNWNMQGPAGPKGDKGDKGEKAIPALVDRSSISAE